MSTPVEIKAENLGGESILEAPIRVLKSVGDSVKKDEAVFVIDTDKTSLEVSSPQDGIITEILVQDGQEIKKDQLLARIVSSDSKQVKETDNNHILESQANETSTIEIKAESLGGESVLEAPIQVLKSVGDKVTKDEVIFIIETDKTSLELSSPTNGMLNEIFVKSGDTIAKGQVLAKILVNYTNTPVLESSDTQNQFYATKKNSPAAVKIMNDNSINPEKITGSGRGSRITKPDVLNYLNNSSTESSSAEIVQPTSSSHVSEKKEERVKMTKIRQVIASRLKESQNTAAILTTFNEVDMKNVMELRAKYKDQFEKKHGIKLGFMSFFTKATVLALQEFREINAEISGDHIVYKNYYDVGIAVGTDKGLVVPVIRNADKMSFAELELTLSRLGKKAKEGKLEVSDMSGATFTITNGGVYGSLLSTPIINPPQSGILGMHSIQNRPVAIGNSVEIRPMMYIALSYDHRIVDGQGAVTFLVRIKQYIEDPHRMSLMI